MGIFAHLLIGFLFTGPGTVHTEVEKNLTNSQETVIYIGNTTSRKERFGIEGCQMYIQMQNVLLEIHFNNDNDSIEGAKLQYREVTDNINCPDPGRWEGAKPVNSEMESAEINGESLFIQFSSLRFSGANAEFKGSFHENKITGRVTWKRRNTTGTYEYNFSSQINLQKQE